MSNQKDVQALTQQVVAAANSLSDEEAAQRYQQILAQLPPEQASELNALALSQVGASDRRNMALQLRDAHQNPNSPFDGYTYDDDNEAAHPINLGRMSARAQQQDPALLGGLLGGNSPLGGQIGKAALAALAALLIRRMMSGQGGMYGQGGEMGGGDPIGAILGGLLGGSGGLGGQSIPQYPSGGGLGGLLGGLLGGGGMGGQQMPQTAPMGQAGDLGGLLGGLLGGGATTQNIPQGGGLGDLLGSILGGGATPDQPGTGSHRR